MAAVDLTEAAYEGLKAEAEREMENSIGERIFADRKSMADYREEHERTLLACADVLGVLQWARLKFGPENPTISVEFSDEALAWMEKARRSTAGCLEDLDTSGEGDLDHCAREAFLIRVLDRVLAANAERVAVAV